MMQGVQTSSLRQSRWVGWGGKWEEGSSGRRHMYTYGRFMLMYGTNQHNIVKLLLLLLSRVSRVRLCATPETAAHQAPLSLGFSRQEHWRGLPFPSPMRESEVAR